MSNLFDKTFSNKSDAELLKLGAEYKKYTQDALVAFLSEVENRQLEIQNIDRIRTWVDQLRLNNFRDHKTRRPSVKWKKRMPPMLKQRKPSYLE